MRTLEFWPDYGSALLHDAGAAVPLDTLDLPPELVARASKWVSRYDDAWLEPGSRDDAWIAQGQAIFRELRTALRAQSIELTDWEGYWSTEEAR